MDYESIYLGKFECDPRQERLHQLAGQYHAQCDEYDKRVCTGIDQRDKCPMPVTAWQRRMVSENAINTLNQTVIEGEKEGFTRDQVRRAISNYFRS